MLVWGAKESRAQEAEVPPVLRARSIEATAEIKVWVPGGSIRLVAWERDSIVVRGRVAPGERFFFAGNARALKLGILDRADDEAPGASAFVVYVPRTSRVSVKTVSADVKASGVSGWFYTVSGVLQLSGAATSVEAEAMRGDVILDVAAPWVRARTGSGHLLVRGAPQDVDASTISGALDVSSPDIMRGRFASVSGDIHYAGASPAGGIFEFSNHSGGVDVLVPSEVGGVFDLSTITGDIENGLSRIRPVAGDGGRNRLLRLDLGRDGSHFTVRTFKGVIRLRPQTARAR